jgi:uncharacterized membrane protein
LKKFVAFFVGSTLRGFLVLAPIIVAGWLLFQGIQTAAAVIRPLASLLPHWFPAEGFLAFLLVLILCFSLGIAVRTQVGRWAREAIERKFLRRIPGYTIVRDLADQIAGDQGQKAWKPVLVEMEDGLVPAFMIEELADGLCTVFVPAVPTPLTGAVFILDRRRIHVLDIPFTQAIKTVTHWGEGAGQLIEAMRDRENTLEASDDRLDFDRKAEP